MGHYFGAELRAWRERRGLSQARLGSLVLHSGASIGKIEKAERRPTSDLARRCDEALNTGGALTRLWQLMDRQRTAAAADDELAGLITGTAATLDGRAHNANHSANHVAAGTDLLRDRSIADETAIVLARVMLDGKEVIVPLDRRALLLGGTALTALDLATPIVRDESALEIPLPGRIGPHDIAELEDAADTVTSWDLRHGGRLAAEQGAALLRWGGRLLGVGMPESLYRRLCSVLGYLADRTAWALYDCGRHDLARRSFRRGVQLAAMADDVDLRVQLLCDMASQSVFLGEPDTALRHVEAADLRRAVPALATAVHGVRAEARAVLGDTRGVWDEIGRAEDAHTRSSGDGPRWLRAFRDESGMYASTGYAAYLLAKAGHSAAGGPAITRLTTAAETLGPARGRAALFGTARLAVLHLSHPGGDPESGSRAARHVLDRVTAVRSARLGRELRTLRTAAAKHEHRPDLAMIGRELDTLLDAAD